MLSLLIKKMIKNSEDVQNVAVRERYGVLCGTMGIALNVLLFIAKIIVGTLSGSIAVTADAINNLSDAGSSVITMLGFKLAGKRPDFDHPFGHGRMEYISGLLVAVVILMMAFELIKSSVLKIITPQTPETSWWTMIVLAAAIAVKLYMWSYNKKYGKKINSAAMLATASDSFNDCIATAVVMISALISGAFDINVDGWCGLLVGLFILYSGYKTAMETVGMLMGKAPQEETVQRIEQLVLSHEGVLGVHDLLVHDYGPGRLIVSLHVEVPAEGNLLHMHDMIDNIERNLCSELGCEATIHMDPVTNDEQTAELRAMTEKIVSGIDPALNIHDFRMVVGPTHTNIIFDVVAPFKFRMTDAELKNAICEKVGQERENCFAVINVDKDHRRGIK